MRTLRRTAALLALAVVPLLMTGCCRPFWGCYCCDSKWDRRWDRRDYRSLDRPGMVQPTPRYMEPSPYYMEPPARYSEPPVRYSEPPPPAPQPAEPAPGRRGYGQG